MARRVMSEKYNDSCLRIFALIKMFVESDAPFAEVIKLFADENGNLTQKCNVTLNKYMNTLDLCGIKVKKRKNKYYLQKMPYSIHLNEHELYAVSLMKSAMSFLPKGKVKTSLVTFIQDLELRYDRNTKNLNKVVASTRNFNLSFYFMQFEKQITQCENYCQEKNKLDLSYVGEEAKVVNIVCVPEEIIYTDDIVCLRVYESLTRQNIDIPIDKITNINVLEAKDNSAEKVCTSVIFTLKGNLAKSYKLRDWETLESKNSDGSITICNRGEDFQALSIRLFKYQDNCVVEAPKYLKNNIKKLINTTLKNYS